MPLAASAQERIRVVIEDLEFLVTSWDQDVSDASLRRSTPIFRRLLVDNDLPRVWHDLGFDKQPILRAASLEVQLRRVPLRQVAYAQAGGATHKGLIVIVPIELNVFLPPEQAAKLFGPPEELPERDYALRRFMKSSCVIVDGVEISRHDLVKYVANKLGGTHFDPRREEKQDDERKFVLLDRVHEQYVVADKPAIYFELLSLGQALLGSSDVRQLLAAGKNALPPPS